MVIEAKSMIDSNPSLVILDVRNESEYVTGHIRNAKLIPLFQLNTSLNQLNPADTILVYCGVGGRSATASQILASNGFSHIYNMLGGITDWAREQYPTYIKYTSIQEAINHATEGDTLYVGQGQYLEHPWVNKSLNLVGENKENTILDGSSGGTVLYVNADNISISDFKIQYSGCACSGYCGINIESNHQNINITNNNVVSDGFAIQMVNVQKVLIIHNNITFSNDYCLVVHDSTQVSVVENNIVNNLYGIDVENSTHVVFSNNNITNSQDGISFIGSANNTISGNIIASNAMYGIYLNQSNNNTFHHNSIQANGRQVSSRNSTNTWDNGLEGNYWSNYTDVDTDNDGIGNTPHVIDAQNIDNFPLVGISSSYHFSANQDVNVISNSTIDSCEFIAPNSIKVQVSNATANETTGFCRISIPHSLIDPSNGTIEIVIDNGQTSVLFLNDTLYDNGTHRWIYFTYQHSTHEILIIPEFPLPLVFMLLSSPMIILAVMSRKRRAEIC
jgi:parallel beta-helix repeat protein